MTGSPAACRFAFWCFATATTFFVVTGITSFFWVFGLQGFAGFTCRLIALTLNPDPGEWVAFEIELPLRDVLSKMPQWPSYEGGTLFIPAWMPAGVFLATTLVLRRFLLRRGRSNQCSCGYDLTGNVSGQCPECGTITRANAK